MFSYKALSQIVEAATLSGKSIGRIVLEDQARAKDVSESELFEEMRTRYHVMKDSALEGLVSGEISASGLSGGAAKRIEEKRLAGNAVVGGVFTQAIAKATAIAERNACMGRIVAAPTAGSCGIIPGVLISLAEDKKIAEDEVVLALFTSAAVGMVIANRAFLSGAEGGCQAECGSAAAMAAAAAADMLGGTPAMAANACALAMKSVLGLVCDPVAGLVEVPCVKRNAAGAANALAAVEMAMAGVESAIPADEVIDAMKSIGRSMPHELRETAKGGLADTPTGRNFAAKQKIPKE